MLINLSIRNFVLIDTIQAEFVPGLNIITGITGGGKSLILQALDFLLGARVTSPVVRSGCEQADVSAVFHISERLQSILRRDQSIDCEGPDLVLRRVYRKDKSNLCSANGIQLPVAGLRRIGDLLVDYLAQNHQLHLQHTDRQLGLVDGFAGLEETLTEYQEAFRAFKACEQALSVGEEQKAELIAELEDVRLALSDLNALDAQPGEDEELKQKISVYEHLAGILAAFQQAAEALYEGDRSAYDAVFSVRRAIEGIVEVPKELEAIAAQAAELNEGLTELVNRMRSYAEASDLGSESLKALEDRYYAIQDMKHKFDRDLDGLIRYREELPARLKELKALVGDTEELRAAHTAALKDVCRLGEALDEGRRKAEPRFEKKLLEELKDLGMPDARFEGGLETRPFEAACASASGFNRVNFLFSANPGTDTAPLKDIASGGEISRIMLAVQGLAGRGGGPPLLVFDEIDSEIGGRMGAVIGRKMKQISGDRQVVCITHLPQLASFGDTHFKIDKTVQAGDTSVGLELLKDQARLDELAHMLDGDDNHDDSTFSEIRRMLERAGNDGQR